MRRTSTQDFVISECRSKSSTLSLRKRLPWVFPDVWMCLALVLGAALMIAAALVTGPILFARWCLLSAPPAAGIALLLIACAGVVLFGAFLRTGRLAFRVFGLVLFLAPIVGVAVARAVSSGEWIADGGPALALLLVALWLGLVVHYDIDSGGRGDGRP